MRSLPLPCEFAYDTESGLCDDGYIRNALIQMCSITAASPDEIVMLEGLDCFERFFALFEETGWRCECHTYNLSYESAWLIPQISRRYDWVPWATKRLGKGTWTCMEDPQSCYCIKICNRQGHILRITDDMKRIGQMSMARAASFVKKEFPEWFLFFDVTKESTEDYNVWFQAPEGSEMRERFLQYAKVDVWSQAMIARWLSIKGRDLSLTRASNGLMAALLMRYRPEDDPSDPNARRLARLEFTRRYPPLPKAMQRIVEDNLLGGYVWAMVGTWIGELYHYDFSSSYPYEYAFGELFMGIVTRVTPEMYSWERVRNAYLFRWVLVSFDFRLKEGMMPAINGSECVTMDDRMVGNWNKKMRVGHCTYKLMTETYFEELRRHYDVSDVVYHEIWVAKRCVGDFRSFIEKCYTEKSRPELRDTMEREAWKADMNTGIHGKTITKTRRRAITYPYGERRVLEQDNDPEFCSLIGFTAMMNARERLLRCCRQVLEGGYRVFVCDTDSMITDCPPKRLEELTRWMSCSKGMDGIGRFETETDKEGKESFDTLKCWGLKRYCEISDGKFRKSAFAGMHDTVQKDVLPGWETDGTEYSWQQKMTKTQKELYGKVIQMGTKHARAEDVWYSEVKPHKDAKGTEPFDEYLLELEMEKARNLEILRWD